MKFSQVVGQPGILSRLREMVSENRVSHALLFAGPEGSGQLPAALAFIQYLNCTNRTSEDSCGQCPSCTKMNKLVHPDLHFVFPLNKTEKVSKDKPVSDDLLKEWRAFLDKNPYGNLFEWLNFLEIENKQGNISERESDEVIRKISLRSFEAEYKCVIIWMAEKMNEPCSNKLLKILEEPPEKTLFVLIVEEIPQLLPTIISRTQLIRFQSLPNETVADYIHEKYQLGQDACDEIARLSEGNLNEAIHLAEEGNAEQFNFEQFRNWMRMCYKKNEFATLLEWIQNMSEIGREKQKRFFQYALMMLRESLIRHFGDQSLSKLSREESEFLNNFYPFFNGANAAMIMEEFNRCYHQIERNANPKILFLDVSLKLMSWLRLKNEEV